MFGELLAQRFRALLSDRSFVTADAGHVDLVEAGAGNGRLSGDVLAALRASDHDLYERVRLSLVERSPVAREAHVATLGDHANKLVASTATLPSRVRGIIFANELLDAFPTHAIVSTQAGLCEVYVDVAGGDLVEVVGPLSTPAIGAYFDSLGVRLPPGFHCEVNLRAVAWVHDAARALDGGFLVIIDYGHDAATLYSESHAAGTLATYVGHTVQVRGAAGQPPWLAHPGERDITSHVDFTSVRRAAEQEGLALVEFTDQTRFLLAPGLKPGGPTGDLHLTGLADKVGPAGFSPGADTLRRRLALKTLLMPGGLGSTMRVMILARRATREAALEDVRGRTPRCNFGLEPI